MKKVQLISLLGLALLSASCRETEFLFHKIPKTSEHQSFSHKVRELSGHASADILWVIDNSGSMMDHQQNVIDNTDVFIQEFSKNAALKWKMGLLSTDITDVPYVGFTPSTLLNFQTPGAVKVFQDAVRKLDTNGDWQERVFTPVINSIKNYPGFFTPGAALALIIVTDTYDQSTETSQDFLDELIKLKGDLKSVFTYGVLASRDFGCSVTDEFWNYAGSKYEPVIQATKGKTYKLCTNDFGKNLADLAKDLVQRVVSPRLHLSVHPIPSTIRVFYGEKELPGGPKESGGIWVYDYEENALVFHELGFSDDDNVQVRVELVQDNGLPYEEQISPK